MRFCCANGLAGIDPETVDTIVCAGMGGEVMRGILESTPWIRQEKYLLLLQPQSVPAEFRAWLFAEGFSILEEYPIFEKGHMYFTMKIRYTGEVVIPTAGKLFVTQQMLQSNSPDLTRYIENVLRSMNKSIDGMIVSGKPSKRLDFLLTARQEILEMREAYALRE
jgi:tRNA (adenine22-N1)-methyltransferase